MKMLLIAGIVLACDANAQLVNVECPKSYPPKPSALEVTPGSHRGRGLVPAKNPLEDWGVFDGEFGGSMQIHTGEAVKVPGGTDTQVPPIRWFVCYYRGGVSWWEETGADKLMENGQIKVGCSVQSRVKGKTMTLVCK
jgi:hypothetical protein